MGERRPAPGHDEIAVSVPPGRCLCHSREHASVGCLAEVIVTFGQLGTLWPDALWPDLWGRRFPMCAACWDATRQVAERHRPGLAVRDDRETAAPPPPATNQARTP